MAPSRGSGFDGQLFFVYDREAVTKEGDPPEDAIIYFYPPSASIESRVSICGQLVGVSNFLTTVLDFAPVLIKLKTEKVALLQSGKYTLAFGGSSTEPESLLLRQLNALFSVFAFYHGSFDNVQKFSKDHTSFLSNITIIWDCYLPFIRYYGDTLPAVFDPLPFLKTPKTSSGSFLKASHILQACQRRRHVLGGCILYKKSVLCTQLEPCITRRLLLFKPNQSHHPANKVKTEINLPFGVRILHSFLTMDEHERLIKELSRSPYHQNPESSQPTGSPLPAEDEQGTEINRTVGERFNGLLHKSVRKRIESESQGVFDSRENRSKAKMVRPKARELISKERSMSFRDKEVPPSPMKRGYGKKKKNELFRSNSLRINISSKQQEDSVTASITSKENGLDQDVHSPAKLVNELPLGKENIQKDDDVHKVSGEFSPTSLTKCEEGGSLEEDGISHPTSSSSAVNTHDECHFSSSSSDGEELTMDEVDVKDLKIVSYAEKDSIISFDEKGRFSDINSSKSQENVEEICNELVQELIEQVVKESDSFSSYEISLNGASVHATSEEGFSSSSFATRLCEGQSSEGNLPVDIPNGHQDQPVSSGHGIKEPINGSVCESNEDKFGTSEGQHSGLLTIATGENGYSNGEYSDPSNKMLLAVSSGSDLGRSTTELDENGRREKSESVITSESEEDLRRNGTDRTLCGNPAGEQNESIITSESEEDKRNGTDRTLCGNPAGEQNESIITSKSEEDQRNGTHSTLCGNPAGEQNESIITSESEEDQRNGVHSTLCGNPAGEQNESIITSESEEDQRNGVHSTLCGNPAGEQNESIITSESEEDQRNGVHSTLFGNPAGEQNESIITSESEEDQRNGTDRTLCGNPAGEQNESIINSKSEEDQRNGVHSTLCGNPAGVKDSFSAMAITDAIGAPQRPTECTIDCSSEIPNDECGSPGSDYHDSLEDLVTDGAKSDEKFLQESSTDLLQDYKKIEQNDFAINKYSPKNINFPKDKNLGKSFFKDLVDGKKDSVQTTSCSETKTSDLKLGESNPKSLDSEANASHKDSRTSSELSEYDTDTTSIDSFTRGCPGDCKNTLGDSGLCLFHEGSDNVSHSETEANSNSVSKDHHGDDDDDDAPELVNGANNLSRGETVHDNDGEDDKEEEVDCDEMDGNSFEVNGMAHLNLYVQAHSNTVLILLAEDQLHKDSETIKALWKTSLNELGELEVRLNQCHENLDHSLQPEDYSYLVYDGLSNTTKGNLEEPVLQADHMFCDTAKTVHEQFNNCSSLRSVTLRNSSSAVHCQRSLGQEAYFHKKGSFKSYLSGSPSPRDPAFTLEKRACKLLHKDHGINVF